MFTFIKRVIEALGFCVCLSALIGALVYFEIIEDTLSQCGVLMTVGAVLFFSVQIYLLCRLYLDLKSINKYFICNIASYAIFFAANVAAYLWGNEKIYGFLFGITKVFNNLVLLGKYKMGIALSAMIFHFLLILLIAFIPVLCRKFLITERGNRKYE